MRVSGIFRTDFDKLSLLLYFLICSTPTCPYVERLNQFEGKSSEKLCNMIIPKSPPEGPTISRTCGRVQATDLRSGEGNSTLPRVDEGKSCLRMKGLGFRVENFAFRT